jgi:phosphoribulokinase
VLGEEHVSLLSGDDYHRYDRARRAQLGVTPLDPAANHLDILAQHLTHLRRAEPVLKPVYDHGRGRFAPAVYLRPARFLIAEGLLNFHTETLRSAHEIRVFLAPQEELHRAWKVKRDCTRRGYTTSQALAELDRRQDDARAYILPQREAADIVVAFRSDGGDDPAQLDVDVILRDTLPHPDLSPLTGGEPGGPTLLAREHEHLVRIPGDLDPQHAAALEESIWERISFANHLRIRRLGEFTVGTDLRRSDSLALVQLILLYHLVRARATINTGPEPSRVPTRGRTGADSALHH